MAFDVRRRNSVMALAALSAIQLIALSACRRSDAPVGSSSEKIGMLATDEPDADADGRRRPEERRIQTNTANTANAANTVMRMRFMHPAARVQYGLRPELHELPETQCGELLLDCADGVCRYSFWYDGVYEHPSGAKGQEHDQPLGPGDGRFRSALKGAAGFDGRLCWVANFPRRFDNGRDASMIVLYEGTEDLHEHDSIDADWTGWPTWFHYAPFHMLMEMVGARGATRHELLRAIESYESSERVTNECVVLNPESAFLRNQLNGGQLWNTRITMDQGDFGITEISLRYMPSFMGGYPYPVPPRYSMRCARADDVEREKLVRAATFGECVGKDTDVVKASEFNDWWLRKFGRWGAAPGDDLH